MVGGVLAEASLPHRTHRQILCRTNAFVAIATVVSSGLWWLVTVRGMTFLTQRLSMLSRGEVR